MSKAAKGLGPASVPQKQGPGYDLPKGGRAAKGIGPESVPQKHEWSAPINQTPGGKKAAPRD